MRGIFDEKRAKKFIKCTKENLIIMQKRELRAKRARNILIAKSGRKYKKY